jgi:chromate transporter
VIGRSVNGEANLPPPTVPLRSLAWSFLRLGATAFGGPAAHAAMMEHEVVSRRGWLTIDEFLDLLGAANLLPGPNSTKLALYVGHRKAGYPGYFVAGLCFILPSVVIVTALAWAYDVYHALPAIKGLLYGIKPVLIAVICFALWQLGRRALRTATMGVVAAGAVGLLLAGIHEILVLLSAGAVLAALRGSTSGGSGAVAASALPVLGAASLPLAATATAAPGGLGMLFLVFLKIGSVLFGSGYVLLAFLRADLVDRYGWMDESLLLDAVALGQIAPGPLFSTATIVGYLLHGWAGAVVATVGIFLPAFVFVAVSLPLLPRLRRSRTARAFLYGVTAASLALMAVVCVQLGRAAIVDGPTVAIAAVAAVLLASGRVATTLLIVSGALVGIVVH